MAERGATQDKRRLLLGAAVTVFARKGYHDCRVGDIATEAGVSYGLLYHYFKSKEEVLETIFRETWTEMLAAVNGVEEAGEPARVQVRKVAAIVLRSWERDPDLIRVLVREITRSPHLQQEIEEISQAFDALERIVRHGQEEGEFRGDLDARLASQVLYGALDQILTGWVLGTPPASEEEILLAERTVAALLCDGLVAEPTPAATA
ncbi:MAG: TetR/AcrR family transcriptional regulator [Gaiellaceae bacterium]